MKPKNGLALSAHPCDLPQAKEPDMGVMEVSRAASEPEEAAST